MEKKEILEIKKTLEQLPKQVEILKAKEKIAREKILEIKKHI